MKKSLYCGGPSIGLSTWLGHLLGGNDRAPEAWTQLQGRQVFGTYRGRTAVALACDLLGLGAGDEVLIPAYNCGTEFDALIKSGIVPVPCRVTQQGELDFEDLVSRKTARTKAVYLIHYFGWEQSLTEAKRWCDAQGLLLIEDCALSLFSIGESGQLGRTGDAAIYSLPKTLGFAHGGLLSLKSTGPLKQSLGLSRPGFSTLKSELRQSARTTIVKCLESAGLYDKVLARRQRAHASEAVPEPFPDMPASYYFQEQGDRNRAIHPKALTAAYSFHPDKIVQRRRSNYANLAAALRTVPEATLLLPELPKGVCPLSLPVTVSNRDECVQRLQAKGIAALPWWAGFHAQGTDWTQFPEACALKRNVLTLPVQHGINDRHLSYIAEQSIHVFKSCASLPTQV